ncbi:MAG: hypothetical protein HON43_03070 [Alphaproteobacteria bacterium]|jgi:hypothetical protein|nr:hypothetical protein [Alphaproteobacteria bacterium]MBT5390015.1 hypothetical protein [Alphaproteobacteria bacterium]
MRYSDWKGLCFQDVRVAVRVLSVALFLCYFIGISFSQAGSSGGGGGGGGGGPGGGSPSKVIPVGASIGLQIFIQDSSIDGLTFDEILDSTAGDVTAQDKICVFSNVNFGGLARAYTVTVTSDNGEYKLLNADAAAAATPGGQMVYSIQFADNVNGAGAQQVPEGATLTGFQATSVGKCRGNNPGNNSVVIATILESDYQAKLAGDYLDNITVTVASP